MKLITLFVGNRLDHVINFDPEEKQIVNTYVIKRDETTELFAFYHGVGGDAPLVKKKKKVNNGNEIVFQSNEGESTVHITSIEANITSIEADKASTQEITSIETNKASTKEISINIELSSADDATGLELKGLDAVGLKFDNTDSSLWPITLDSYPQSPVLVKVTFNLSIGLHKYTQHVHLCVAKVKEISDIVLDFGSEASQIGIFKREVQQQESDIRELFTEMKELLEPAASSNDKKTTPPPPEYTLANSFVQRENNKNFFKSVFFAKKQLTNSEAGTCIPELDADGIHAKENQVMRLLTTQNEAQELVKSKGYIQIPNVKITQFGGVKQPKIGPDNDPILDYKDGYFYRASINLFILNALNKAKTPCVSLYVLMPNVYSQLSVFSHLQWIREDIQEILSKNERLRKRIKAVELSAISESDASLLGAIRVIEDKKNKADTVDAGKYIIIDAGKGTLDFSAIRYETDPEPKVYSVYRSGIIGAGNALTYAYFFALLKDYMNQVLTNEPTDDELRSFIFENVLGGSEKGKKQGGGDMANLLKLMQAVEHYKIAIGTQGSNPNKSINPLTSNTKVADWHGVQMTALTDFVKKMVDVGTRRYKPLSESANQYVTKTINQIVDEVYDNLSILKSMDYGKADGVIFAGRGFALPEFKNAMKLKLEREGIVDKEIEYISSSVSVNRKSVCLYIRTAIQEGQYNNHMTSVPIVLRKGNGKTKEREEKKDFFSRMQESLGFGKKKAENHVGQTVGDFLRVIVDSREKAAYHTPGSTDANGMVSGFLMEVINGDMLMIGGTKYRMTGINGSITVFFSGEKIFCRYRNDQDKVRVKELTEDGVNLQNSPFLFGTLFPNVDVDELADINLPFDLETENRKLQKEENARKKIKKGKEKALNGNKGEDASGNSETEDRAKQDEADAGKNSASYTAVELAKSFKND